MDAQQFLQDRECFSLSTLEQQVGDKGTARKLVQQMLNDRNIIVIRRGLYSVIDRKYGFSLATPPSIATALSDDSCLTHHSAFDFYGCANQIYSVTYVASTQPFSSFEFMGMRYKHVPLRLGTEVCIKGRVRITTREQTVIDGIDDIDVNEISDVEETIQCMTMIAAFDEPLDEDALIKILKLRDNSILWRKVGYMTEQLNEEIGLSNSFFDTCLSCAGTQEYPVSEWKKFVKHCPWGQYPNEKWGILAPRSLYKYIDQGVPDIEEVI